MNNGPYRISKPTLLAVAVATAVTSLTPLYAQQDTVEEVRVEAKSFRAVRVDTAPVLDGSLDDAVWQQAAVVTDFHQTQPGDHTPTSEPTELYVIYTEDALYVGARMYDSNPELIAAPTIRHGQGLPFDDRLVIILDPFNQGQAGYRFETNLNGVRHDSLYVTPTSFSLDWNTIWETATSVDGNSWVAEVEIPFKSLPFDPRVDTWGFNFGRGIRRRNEEMAWVSLNRNYNPTIMGEMTGMEGMNQGVGLDIVPSVTAIRQRRYNPADSEHSLVSSLDAFYRLTPSLNAAVTVNTDFSAADVDNRQVNLTRFNLFFPERRDFFLNDSDLFTFGNIDRLASSNNAATGPSGQNGRPYFSRKLGLAADGSPVDIQAGGRISGRVGRFNIGTLAIRQDSYHDIDASDLLVARMSANVLADSRVGFIYTDGDPTSNQDNRVMGADFQYVNNEFMGNEILQADAFYQQSDTPGLNGDDASYGFGIRYPQSEGFRARMAYKVIEENFYPAMGYINRSDVDDLTADFGYTHYFSNSDLLQTAFAGVDMQRIENLDGGLQSEVFAFRLLELETTRRDAMNLAYYTNREVVRSPFTIYREPGKEVIIQPGTYDFNEQEIGFTSAGQREFSGGLRVRSGDFFSGDRLNVGSDFSWNQSRYFRMTLSYDWNDIDLPQGEFITRLASVNTQVAFSSTLYWITLAQYDNISEELGINTRLQWIPRAGQEGFIVLNYNMEDRDRNNTFHTGFSDISIKFRYTFRF
ncbi:MAG: carbohydrate binding family 9 domain-containing protein [Gammaproteobacteria bacterium]|nr:carbohydrate binding family 9 domain-containing protein [Pseudomonadales bacterium]MCP5347922.1 carbohydrate binding family 9 domain-containing protein [Pseudomonadales bacterium]